MNTVVINHLNTDKVSQIIICEYKYLVFTLHYSNLIVIEMTDTDKPILLLNRFYGTKDELYKGFDKIINKAIKINSNDDFISSMDTSIDLIDSKINNETIEEIICTYRIILEDYNLS